jgi:hypothetical protein
VLQSSFQNLLLRSALYRTTRCSLAPCSSCTAGQIYACDTLGDDGGWEIDWNKSFFQTSARKKADNLISIWSNGYPLGYRSRRCKTHVRHATEDRSEMSHNYIIPLNVERSVSTAALSVRYRRIRKKWEHCVRRSLTPTPTPTPAPAILIEIRVKYPRL